MYNAPALASIFIAIVCLVLLYTVLVQEYPGLAKGEQQQKGKNDDIRFGYEGIDPVFRSFLRLAQI